MGNRDIEKLNEIYSFANDFCQLASLPFRFKEDTGSFETAIVFNELTKSYRRPKPHETWKSIKYPEMLLCPDILDYDHKIIFEYEEETGNKRPGAKLARKGHGHEGDFDTKRDTRRNTAYALCKFRLLRIWQSQLRISTVWKLIVIKFLLKCFVEIMEEKS